MNNLEDIKNRLAAATPGPWHVKPVSDGRSDIIAYGDYYSGRKSVATAADSEFGASPDDDAEFIAHAPEDVARLVKALEDVLEHIGWAEMNKSHWVSANSLRAKITEALDS